MTKKPYGLVHAMSLLAPCGASDQWVITDCGVLPKPQPKLRAGQTQTAASHLEDFHPLLAWRPAVVFKDETPAHDLINTPSLPFPFDAKDLAAFMLSGVGSFVADFYGEWEGGPNKLAIDQINPLDTFARQAVIEAFAACREAQKNVGPFPFELYDKAERSRKAWNEANKDANHREGVFDSELDGQELEYRRDCARASMDVFELEIVAEAFETNAAILRTRRERAKESTATLELEMWAAVGEAGTAHQKWLEAMVRGLLEPGSVIPESESETKNIQRHTLKSERRRSLQPEIEHAQSLCKNPVDTAEVWSALQKLAEKKHGQLLGATEEGLQYLELGEAKTLTRDALQKRLNRGTQKARIDRR